MRFLVDANNTPKPSVATLLLECDDTGHVSANPDSLLDDLIVLTLGGQLRLTYSYFLAFILKKTARVLKAIEASDVGVVQDSS